MSKLYKTTKTLEYRVRGFLADLGGGLYVESTMLEIPAGTEVIITKTGINEFHPDMCEAYIHRRNLYIQAISMIGDLEVVYTLEDLKWDDLSPTK
jgi:hypothetical protein